MPDRNGSDRVAGAIPLRLPNLYRTVQILAKPDLMLGQAYVDGHWDVPAERLYEFLLLLRSQEAARLLKWFTFWNRFHPLRDSLKQRRLSVKATRAVGEHYNTDSEFMSCILGRSLSYTCAFFDGVSRPLEEAQERKVAIIADRIALSGRDTVLDLGCGWGYPAIPLSESYGCAVTGLTVSNVQLEVCRARAFKSPAVERLYFYKQDFCTFNPEISFTRVVSTGMLEHVGKYRYKELFDKISDMLQDGGVALVHGMIDERETTTDAWIERNIFPGGYIPQASEVLAAIEDSRCELVTLFTHPKNYFQTLGCWIDNLLENRTHAGELLERRGLSGVEIEAVLRLWQYFLASSRIAFSERYGTSRVAQFLVRKS
jgi:cyclopropane-fatty-acyl-phospholipid synthase